jgi:hypothetical protein
MRRLILILNHFILADYTREYEIAGTDQLPMLLEERYICCVESRMIIIRHSSTRTNDAIYSGSLEKYEKF